MQSKPQSTTGVVPAGLKQMIIAIVIYAGFQKPRGVSWRLTGPLVP